INPQAAFSRVPRQDGPASSRHGTLREVFDESFHGAIARTQSIDELARVFGLAVAAEDFEIPFVKINTIDRVCFTILEAANFAVCGIAAIDLSGNDRASQLFETVFDFIFLRDVSGVELVVMVLESPV